MGVLMSTDHESLKQTAREAKVIDASTSEPLVLVASICECSVEAKLQVMDICCYSFISVPRLCANLRKSMFYI
jgi:hypothetical protein